MTSVTIITTHQEECSELENIFKELNQSISWIYWDRSITVEPIKEGAYFVYLSQDDLKTLFLQNHEIKAIFTILPHPNALQFIHSYNLPKNLREAITSSLNTQSHTQIDLLVCNEQVVFHHVSIGNMHGLYYDERTKQLSFFKRLLYKLRLLGLGKYVSFSLKTAKDQTIDTVAMGALILEHSNTRYDNLKEHLSFRDGKLSAFILSPSSLFSYAYYIVLMIFYHRLSLLALPKGLGFIQTSKLIIESAQPLHFSIDRAPQTPSTMIDLVVLPKALTLQLSNIEEKESSNEEKDIIKVDSLPVKPLTHMLLSGKVFFFERASETSFKTLFQALRKDASFSSIFSVLMILSSLLSTTGLFQNSTPVIIGAMILAPLMAPIISLSMGLIRAEEALIVQSLKTLIGGIVIATTIAMIYTLCLPLEIINDEIKNRLNPNVLDLIVAIVSGIAGAYASAREEVAKSFAGVAIAVALVPPLNVMGIGLGWGNMAIASGAFLLFITNLIGIILAGSLTFIVMGYAPFKRAQKSLLWTVIALCIIIFPLYNSFTTMIEHNRILKVLEEHQQTFIPHEKLTIKPMRIRSLDHQLILEIEIVSNNVPDHNDMMAIKTLLQERFHKEFILEIVWKKKL